MLIDYHALLSAALDIGENMLKCGAEVSRVEDSILRICRSYGVQRVDVLTITSCIVLTLHLGSGRTITQTRRIHMYATDFHKLDELNELSRHIVATTPDMTEVNRQIENVLAEESSTPLRKFLGPIMAASGFCLFFGGRVRDMFAVALISIFEVLLERRSRVRKLNQIAFYFMASFFCGVLSIFSVRLKIGVTADKIMIGTIMLLIPGLAFTNAIRDLLSGDIITGLLRLFESLLEAASIACGFAAAILLFGKGVVGI
ncbi:MAG: threonine/serine exporter ThrE family protein [Lachnospiraceae bacterium]